MEPYERLIGDAMNGNSQLFTRQDASEIAWRIVGRCSTTTTPPHVYEPGTWGPAEAMADFGAAERLDRSDRARRGMMADGTGQAPLQPDPVVLAIDVGGSHVKIKSSASDEERRTASGPTMTAAQMVKAVKTLAKGLDFEVVSIGYPGPVHHGRPVVDPANLGKGWAGFDFRARFGKPVKIVNDALMQGIGSYQGGRMLFLGLGTGLGAAMIVDNVAQPMEIAHLPYKKDAPSRTMSASAASTRAVPRNGAPPSSTSWSG